MSDGRNRLRSLLDTALTVAAVAASLLAVGVVIALVWWVHSLSSDTPREATVANALAAARQQAAPPARKVPAPPAAAAPAVERAAAPAAPPPTAAPTAALPPHGQNDDAAKNRALGAALSRLGDDPELQRKLRMNGTHVPP